MVRLRTALVSLAVIVSLSWPLTLAGAQPSCRFTLGFATMRELVGTDRVGDCVEDERFNVASGDAEQRTTGGLLIWRHVENDTVFIDGTTIWVNGSNGLQSRPIGEPFDGDDGPLDASQPASSTTAATMASLPPGGASVLVLPPPQAVPPASNTSAGSNVAGPAQGEPPTGSDPGSSAAPTRSGKPSSSSNSEGSSADGRTEPVDGACPPSHKIKGATASKGQKLFYEPDRPEYAKVTPEACFTAGGDARDAGYVSSKR
jgi:hypothetical protein